MPLQHAVAHPREQKEHRPRQRQHRARDEPTNSAERPSRRNDVRPVKQCGARRQRHRAAPAAQSVALQADAGGCQGKPADEAHADRRERPLLRGGGIFTQHHNTAIRLGGAGFGLKPPGEGPPAARGQRKQETGALINKSGCVTKRARRRSPLRGRRGAV